MINNIGVQKLKEQYPDFFKKHSKKLLDFIFSEKTSLKIAEVCLRNKIEEEEKIKEIANRIILALLGEFPQEKLPEVFEKGLKLTPKTAQKIYTEINKSIFSQVKKTPSPGEILNLK